MGIPLSHLWWLVNERQQTWILFCYAWEVPLIGWTGAVLIPYLIWRRAVRGLARGDGEALDRLVRYPLAVAALFLATSTVGYLLGGVQLRVLAALPLLEMAKFIVQGVVLGAVLGAAGYLFAERAVDSLPRPATVAAAWPTTVTRPLYGKILSFTALAALGLAVPILLVGLTSEQQNLERARGAALEALLRENTPPGELVALGGHTMVFTVNADGRIADGPLAGRSLVDAGFDQPGRILSAPAGWLSSRTGQHRVVAFQRLPASGAAGVRILVAVSPLTDFGDELARSFRRAIAVFAVALALCLALAALFTRSVVEPIARLRATAEEMASGRTDVEAVEGFGGDEVAALAREFNLMARRVRTDETALREAYQRLQLAHDRLVQAEKLSAIGRLVSGVAHELNNPLSAILHFSEDLLLDPERPAQDREALEAVSAQARRARSIVRDLLSFVRGIDHAREEVAVEALLHRVTDGVEGDLASAGVRLEVRNPAAGATLVADPHGLEQILTNLVLNAADACGRGGEVTLLASSEDGSCVFVVEDTGPGIAPDALPRIFEPFFTTKPPGQGTGLGLFVSLGIAEQHGGSLAAENRAPWEGGGARFTLRVPVGLLRGEEDEETMSKKSDPAPAPQGHGRRVLIVEDEESIRSGLRRFLVRLGWEVEEAVDGVDGLARLLPAPPGHYAAVITDLRMPQRSGIELHDILATKRPDLFERLVIMTGDVASPSVAALLARTTRPVIEKPFELAALADHLGRLPQGGGAAGSAAQ